ncbi:MAG TPA: RDD family protein [Cryptosporangiaceae bacterium]|nr:RDD family protein [Cryptosporangiaceae bacterium]
MSPEPGWYPDPAAPETQRYWDGEQWVGEPIPADAEPPPGPPPAWLTPPAARRAAAGTRSTAARADEPASPTGTTPTGTTPTGTTPTGTGPTGGTDADNAAPVVQAESPATGPAVPVTVPGLTTPVMLDVGRLAPVGLRVAARLIDIAVVLGLNILVNGYFFVQYLQLVGPAVEKAMDGGGANPFAVELPEGASTLVTVMVVVAIALWLAYEVPATANSGQTLGKRVVGIQVRRIDDSPLTMGQSLRRWMIQVLPSPLVLSVFGLPLQLLDYVWCLWDQPARQCLHDKAVSSIVVRADRSTRPAAPAI